MPPFSETTASSAGAETGKFSADLISSFQSAASQCSLTAVSGTDVRATGANPPAGRIIGCRNSDETRRETGGLPYFFARPTGLFCESGTTNSATRPVLFSDVWRRFIKNLAASGRGNLRTGLPSCLPIVFGVGDPRLFPRFVCVRVHKDLHVSHREPVITQSKYIVGGCLGSQTTSRKRSTILKLQSPCALLIITIARFMGQFDAR